MADAEDLGDVAGRAVKGERDQQLTVLERSVPGVASLRTYQRSWLRSDLVAGIVLAAILVPQGMAYAELAGLPPVNGLYTTVACLVGYALMGPSKILVLGPDSSLGPLIFAAITPLVVAGDDPATAIALAGMLAILVGLIEIALGVGKLGFVADLLSSEVQVGYMNGLAITIIVGQLPKLSGFSTEADSFVEEVREFVTNFDQRNSTALAMGLATLAVLLLLPRVSRAIPAVLVAVVGATVVTALFDLDLTTVGTLPEGLPVPAVPWTNIGDVGPLLIAAIGITLVSLTDTIALSTSFNAKRGEQVRPNQEMIGIGSANIAAGFFQGFAISSSSSRTAVAEQSGAKSQLTGLVGAGVVVLLLLFFNGLLADLPNSALAAVVIAAALSLADFAVLARVWKVRRSAVVLSIVASAGVIFLGVLEGIVVAVVLSILLFFQRNWWPHGEVLGRVPGRDGWHSDSDGNGLVERSDVVVFRWEAPLFFANSGMFAEQVRDLAQERRPGWIVLQCEAITDIDVTAAGMLERLDKELNAKGVHLAFVELRSRLRDLVHDYGLFQTLDREHFYGSIEEALADIGPARGEETSTS
jgi:high affinity sulfate transporter 1